MSSDTDGGQDNAIDFDALARRIAAAKSRGPASRINTRTPTKSQIELSEMIADIAGRRDEEDVVEASPATLEPETVTTDISDDSYDDDYWPEDTAAPVDDLIADAEIEAEAEVEPSPEEVADDEIGSEPEAAGDDSETGLAALSEDEVGAETITELLDDASVDVVDEDVAGFASAPDTMIEEEPRDDITVEDSPADEGIAASTADGEGFAPDAPDEENEVAVAAVGAEDADPVHDFGDTESVTEADYDAEDADDEDADARSEPAVPLTVAAVADAFPPRPTNADVRRPRIALMGEFSAGKSTLSNLLIGARSLPVNVTATQLPPVWLSKGSGNPYRVDLDGEEHAVDLNQLEQVEVEETSHIRIFRDADLLEICDLIDMPGISDPNMSADVWQRLLPQADAIIWCTHATQAWRQSEAAVWSFIPPHLQERSLLVLTRMDKILTDRDRQRVMKRVARETEGLFRGQYGISLTQALAAEDDYDAWCASGAEEFSSALVSLIRLIARDIDMEGADTPAATSRDMSSSTSLTERPRAPAVVSGDAPPETELPSDVKVIPSRVRPRPLQGASSRRSERPGGRELRL